MERAENQFCFGGRVGQPIESKILSDCVPDVSRKNSLAPLGSMFFHLFTGQIFMQDEPHPLETTVAALDCTLTL